jgi:hypothetical protein
MPAPLMKAGLVAGRIGAGKKYQCALIMLCEDV